MNILLIQPNFPRANKSKNHSDFLPIGLLKLATYYRNKGYEVRLISGEQKVDLIPNKILVTSLFTYWSKYVKQSVQFYKEHYPNAIVSVGGIFASLMPKECKKITGCDEVHVGIHEEAEKCEPAYDLVDIDYQIIHTTRGCKRECKFCGTWKIEPNFTYKKSIKDEFIKNKVVIYDNNLLANPFIESILDEIRNTKVNGRLISVECQSGLDGRLLTVDLAKKIKLARFRNPRIAWDGKYKQWVLIEKQIQMLLDAGYNAKDIYIFVLYNWDLTFEEMELKRLKCREWGVQIADCRFRPLFQLDENYNPRAIDQTNNDYFIHGDWNDQQVKQFRRNVREQNICIRHGFEKYNHDLEVLGKKTNG